MSTSTTPQISCHCSDNNRPYPKENPGHRCLLCSLPPLVDNVQKGWQASCSSASVVSTLFAGVSSQLIGTVLTVKDSDVGRAHPHAVTFLLIVSYGAIIFNSSATVTSLLLIDTLGDLPVRASDDKRHLRHYEGGWIPNYEDILSKYGINPTWKLTMWHWLIALFTGILCIFLQVLTYIYLQESIAVQVTMTCAVGFAVLPLIHLTAIPFFGFLSLKMTSEPK